MSLFNKLLSGDSEMKGLDYWHQNIEAFKLQAIEVQDAVIASLEEKRSFYSFMLTIATVFLSPATILTGYWGMNFDNVRALPSLLSPLASLSSPFSIAANASHEILTHHPNPTKCYP